MTDVIVKTHHGDKTATIPEGWHRVSIEGDKCQAGDRFYNIHTLVFEDIEDDEINTPSIFFELLIRKNPKPKRQRK